MDNGHVVGDEFDEELAAKRRRFEELLGNANGYAPVLSPCKVLPNVDLQRTEIIPSVKATFYHCWISASFLLVLDCILLYIPMHFVTYSPIHSFDSHL